MSELEGKVAVVAGASTGIGRAAAERFAAAGADVVLLARRQERLQDAAAAIGAKAVPVVADISDPDSVRSAFAVVKERFGGLHALLNVAGVARARRIEESSDEDIATVVGTNFLGPIYTTRAAIPLMRAVGGGDIVNISSEVTLDDLPLMTLYSSTKRALDGFTRTMTKELKEDRIRVTLVVMGAVAGTSFSDNFEPGEIDRVRPVWDADGYTTRVAGGEHRMEADWVADAMLYAVTRPTGMMMDVIHTRSAGFK